MQNLGEVAQGSAPVILFGMVDATDFNTPETGVTVTLTATKIGAVLATPGGVVSEVGNGWYKYQAVTADTDTKGPLGFYATGTGCAPRSFQVQVVEPAKVDPITYVTELLDDYGLNLVNEEVRRIRIDQDRRSGRE